MTTKFLFLFTVVSITCDAFEKMALTGQWQVTNGNKSIQAEANVPGGIYTDLQSNQIIGNPYFRFNDISYRWVSNESWNYSRNFSVSSELLQHVEVNLVCDGLDTVSQIFINNRSVGKSEDMFVRYTFNVKDLLKIGINTIEISFQPPVEYALEQSRIYLIEKFPVPPLCPVPVQNGECHVNFIRKIQSSFSWDWGPAFPSVGIWKNISLEALDEVKITDVTVHTQNNAEKWQVDLQIFLKSVLPKSSQVGTLRVLLDSVLVAEQRIDIPVGDCDFTENISFPVQGINEWWPNGYGDQHLYNLTVLYVSQISEETTKKSLMVGFRTVELVQDPIGNNSGLTFYFRINGKAVFLKGSNWIPADSFPERVTTSYIRRLLQSAKDAHMNALRVWGGGMYETDDFYKIADELGILLWHDLMFACAMYPASENFLDLVKIEVSQQVKRLQHHPSILLWAGNNENEAALMQNWYQTKSNFENYKKDYLELYINTIKPIVDSLDNSRPFIASSPSNGLESEKEGWLAKNPQDNLYGDVHFYIYDGDTWNWNNYPVPRFVSEFGFQSWSSFESLQNISVEEDWDYDSELINSRQHHALGNKQMYLGILLHMHIPDICSEASGCNSTVRFRNLIYLTQIFQAMSLKTETEHYLRHQNIINEDGEGNTMGVLYWQLNDIWQCPSWASIEYGGKWKMAHYFAKNFYSPQLISPLESDGNLQVYLITNPVIPPSSFRMVLSVYEWKSFVPVFVFNMSFISKEVESQKIFESKIDDLLNNGHISNRSYCFIYVQLYKESVELSNNWLLLTNFTIAQGLQIPDIKVTVLNETSNKDGGSDFELELSSNSIAPFVWLEVLGISGRFSDNGFLLVNPTKIVTFHSWQFTSKNDISSRLNVNSLMKIY